MAENELRMLIRKRGYLKGSLTAFRNFIDSVKEKQDLSSVDIIQVQERLSRIESIIEDFHNVQCNIEMIVDNQDEQLEEKISFENSYFTSIAQARNILKCQNNNDDIPQQSRMGSSVSSLYDSGANSNGVKLPTIELPKFKGNYEVWLEYRDTFESLIHKNNSLSNIQNFHYLRASLEGSPAQVIKSIEFTSASYTVAWNTLCDRFDNKKLLVHNHVKALFSIETVQKASSFKIRRLIDSISKHLRSLEQLEQKTENWDTLLIFMITSKLDDQSVQEWEKQSSTYTELPTWINLKDFLQKRANLLETLELKNNEKHFSKRDNKPDNTSSRSLITTRYLCSYCKKEHSIYKCDAFLKLSIPERNNFVSNSKLCENCLREGHSVKSCKIGPCRKCKLWHNSLLHNEESSQVPNRFENNTIEKLVTLNASNLVTPQVLLSTAIVRIRGKNKIYNARALLDCGSQTSFITERMCKILDLEMSTANLSIYGISNFISKIQYKCQINIESLYTSFHSQLVCFVLPEITSHLPSVQVNKDTLKIPQNISLADPEFFKPSQIDMLIGADLFWNLLSSKKFVLGSNQPIIQETKLGWIISGQLGIPHQKTSSCNLNTTISLDKLLQKFWQIEEINSSKIFSEEELACERHFKETTTRGSDGRFIVSLPLKQPSSSLGHSRIQAEKRLYSVERKLQRNPILRDRYIQFMNEYESLGHMTDVTKTSSTDEIEYFMPHHGVLNEESTTTKLRVVFDASAPSSNGLSLNNIQLVGPQIQDDLLAIVLRFRKYRYVISSDVSKMYRQVLVHPSQRNLQKIVWRSDPSKPLKYYALNTVTYGQAAASFLAIRSLIELANDCEASEPDISEIIRHDFYVDDLLSGADSLERASYISHEIARILKTGGFELKKWHSNEIDILKGFAQSDLSTKSLDFSADERTKTLGLTWSSKTDRLHFNINLPNNKNYSKRIVLSIISSIFDPLGLLSPCTVISKLIMRDLWSIKVNWDDPLPESILCTWIKFQGDLNILNEVIIPRHVICKNPINIDLHGFADSSERAYGACIYVRSMNENGEFSVNLLCAKSKVAPIKTISIPKLELCAALLLARLADKVIQSMKITFGRCYLWSDATIVLAWIKTSPNLLKTFVANRVSEIQILTESFFWMHTPSQDNPCDILSRGLYPSQIINSNLWWNGPPWLQMEIEAWPKQAWELNEMLELKTKVFFGNAVDKFPINRFSCFNRLKRVTALLLRFRFNCSTPEGERQYGFLTKSELDKALKVLIKISQLESFQEDLYNLKKNQVVSSKSKILGLTPFLDEEQLIRVGGRLKNSSYNFDKKHPIILCPKHRFTKLLFEYEHLRLFHSGPNLLLSSIREQFWPVSGRNLAKETVRKCVRCFRFNPSTVQPIMSDLPHDRVTPSSPFTVTGVDYAGPFQIRDRKGRGSKLSKCYVSIFICFSTKALHLELVSSLSSESFVLALRRFVARRGKPSKIYSDNGTNFVGASKELGRYLISRKSDMLEYCSKEEIEWHFIPPHSPHFGGLWEAGVKSFKHHLRRVVGNTKLLFEELTTILAQIEGILNSRPICPLTSDPNDLRPLSPAHFLIGRSLVAAPDNDLIDQKVNRLTRFQLIQQACQNFWRRWSKEYVSELQQKTQWKRNQGCLENGSLVLIKDDQTMPTEWRLGRIIHIHLGSDGIGRVASVKTSNGVIKRSFAKLCPLPIERHSGLSKPGPCS